MKKISILLISFLMLISILPFNPQEVYAASWLEEELDGNEPFITATEKALGKNRADITLADLESIQKLLVFGSASIPNQISDYKNLTTLEARSGTITEVPDSIGELKKLETLNLNQNKLQEFPMITLQLPVLKNLYINTGNITEIPAEITTMSSHLISLDIRFQNLISLPSVIFTTSWTANADKKLIISTSENQLVSNIPQNYLDDFNNKNNMLEFYNFPPEDFRQHQDQLVYKGEAIEVPLNTDFNLLTPDKANLGLKSNKALFAQHEFVYYDDGTSSDVLVDGVATNPGSGYITIKSSLSTNSNPFAKVKVPIIVTSPVKGADITVQYVDTDGNAIAVEDVLTGNVDDNYTSSPKTIAGYTLKTTPANANGLFSDQAQTVTYVYTKDPVAAEPVTVQYVDTDGNAITTEDVLTGNIGDNYTSSPKTIAGYTLKTTP
ncbi:hypothetical protein HCJ45_13150, partial [Listeria sp. FSL L7-1517]|uniref:MucBP domain-containing protein n=1 Tax=Listeria immobilis TaxID=2713502 RepID=UPI00164E6559